MKCRITGCKNKGSSIDHLCNNCAALMIFLYIVYETFEKQLDKAISVVY